MDIFENFPDKHADSANLSPLVEENLESFIICDAWYLSDALFILNVSVCVNLVLPDLIYLSLQTNKLNHTNTHTI